MQIESTHLFHAAALLACAALAACSSAPLDAAPQAVQVTQGFYLDPSFSPDGEWMVVVAVVGDREQLAVMRTDGSDVTVLTNDEFDHEDPSWSPDGRSIAYVSFADGGEVIHVMNADGSNVRAVTPETQRAIHPTWTPDSRTLLYCNNDDVDPPAKNAAQIYAVDVTSREVRTLITGGVNTYPNMSPDGRYIAFRKMVDETNSEVWVATADGADERNLTNHAAFDGWPAWSPDGRWIVFASDRGGNQQIHVMTPDGENVRLVAATPDRGTAPQWSRDGADIFFPVCSRGPDGGGCEIYRAPAPVDDGS